MHAVHLQTTDFIPNYLGAIKLDKYTLEGKGQKMRQWDG